MSSTCNCGINKPTIPKPVEEGNYASVKTAYDTLKTTMNKNKKFTTFEYFLIVVIILIMFTMIKDYKC
tara:strand:- start:4464 stop:4667 length:204 start_codon:yes stop_codon:yes gene_type:complete